MRKPKRNPEMLTQRYLLVEDEEMRSEKIAYKRAGKGVEPSFKSLRRIRKVLNKRLRKRKRMNYAVKVYKK